MTRVFFLLILLILSFSFASAQTITPVSPTSKHLGYLEYLPPNYSSTTENYPCIIFLHGSGEVGNGLEPNIWLVAKFGPLYHIRNNKHTMCFSVNGKQECFIVIGPQAPSGAGFNNKDFENLHKHILSTYRVDPDRIYVTGLSMGGQSTYIWSAGAYNASNLIAAIAPMSASAWDQAQAYVTGDRDIPIWHHHGDKDGSVHSYTRGVQTINWIKSRNPTPDPIFTVYPNVGHSAWVQGYTTDYTYNKPNLYEWFLSHRLNRSVSVNLGADRSITLPTNSINLNSTINSTNPIQTYAWTKQSGPAATLVNATTSVLTVNNMVAGTYIFRLTVTDNQGNQAFDEITINVLPEIVNQPPTANAGADQMIALPTNIAVFNGSGSDSDGTIVSYAWQKVSGPSATLQNQNTASLTALNLLQGTYVFGLTVTDDKGATGYDEVKLTVEAANIPPTVNAGTDKTIQLPTNTIVINGTASDPDGSIASYQWTKRSGPTATLQNATTANLTASNLLEGTYIFRLTVTDNKGATVYDEASVIVQAVNQAPVANAGADKTLKLPVNSTTINGSGTDSDGTVVSYAWTKVSGPAATLTNTGAATLTLSNLVEGIYVFGLVVTDDDGATGYDEVRVTVNAANIVPVANAGSDQEIYLPTNTTTLNGTGTDSDGSVVSYAWQKKNGPSVTLTNADKATATLSNLVEGTYTFILTVTDNEGAKGTDEVTVIVMAANIPPVANAGSDQNITLPTNQINLSGSGTDTDGTIASYNWVKVSGPAATMSGANTTLLRLTNLVEGTYLFGLTVTDDKGATGYDEVRVVVSPEPVNLVPVVNAGSDIAITLPVNSVALSATASDPDGSIASYLWQKRSGPAATISSATTANTNITNLVAGTYVFRITVTDNKGTTAYDEVNVVVYEAVVNKPPLVNAGSDVFIRLPQNSVTFNPSVSDPDGAITSIQWIQVSGPNSAAFSNATISNAQVSGLAAGVYVFRISATDNEGATSGDEISVTVSEANKAPLVNAGNDVIIQLPENTVALTATASDPDGSISTYLWSRVSGPNGEILTNANTQTVNVSNLIQGIYVFQVTVTDNEGATASDQVKVTVQAENIIPTANAGNDIVVQLPDNSVNITGSGSDADGTVVSYQWSKESGPMVSMVNQNTTTLTLNNLLEGTYVFRLTVTDNNGASNFDDVKVTVLPEPVNAVPVANAGPDRQLTLPTNSITLNGSGTDSDGTIASYAWSKLTGPSVTMSNANTASLTLTNLVEGVYTFRLRVTDNGGATAIDDVQVIVNPAVNQNPVANAGPDHEITLPTNSLNINGSGSDPDGTIVSYLWEKVSGPTVTMSNTDKNLLVLTNLVEGSYTFKLTVTDDKGATSFDQVTVIVNAEDVNQAPTANAGDNISLKLPTNTAILKGSGSDADGSIVTYAWIKLSGPTAVLQNANMATLTVTDMVEGTYTFRLTVTDNEGAQGSDQVRVIVVRAEVNENPVVSAGYDIFIQQPTSTAMLRATASDNDGSIASYSWTQISGTTVTIANPALATTTVSNLQVGEYVFRITVTDNQGATDFDEVKVVVLPDDVNIAPVAETGDDVYLNLPTNSVTATGTGSDIDGSIVLYQWIKISGPSVVINNPNSATVNFSGMTEGTYTFRFTVTDNDGGTGQDELRVYVAPEAVNQAPVANAGADIELILPENGVTIAGGGNDPDGTIVSYLWEKVTGPAFTLTETDKPNLKLSGLTEGVYSFRLTVTDDKGATGSDYVTVTVHPELTNQLPSVDLGSNIIVSLPLDSIVIKGKATDPDGDIVEYKWMKITGATIDMIEENESLILKNLKEGTYIFRLTVTDDRGGTASDDIIVTVNPASVNRNPVSNAGSDQSLVLPENAIIMYGSGSDPDGDQIDFNWVKLSGPGGITMDGTDSETLHLSGLVAGTYVFELIVTDSKGASASDQVRLIVYPENQAPTADAGDDMYLNMPVKDYYLIGTASDDDGYIISYEWRMISGPKTDNFVTYSDTLTLNGLQAGTYIYELTVMDNDSVMASDQVTVIVSAGKLDGLGAHKVFSPDGNGIDDLWIIDNLDMIAGCQLTIFNRFGLKVYESNNYQNEWDGTYSGQALPEGDYYFVIKCNDSSETASGGIRIIRKL